MKRLPSNVELDDLVQAGMIGLHEALPRFKADAGATIETFLSRRIRGAMLDELRREDWLSRGERKDLGESFFMSSLDITDDDGNAIDSYEIAAEEETERHVALKQMMYHLVDQIDKLSERERQVLSMIYEHDMSHIQVGVALEVSASRVSQIHSKIVDRLALRMRKAGF